MIRIEQILMDKKDLIRELKTVKNDKEIKNYYKRLQEEILALELITCNHIKCLDCGRSWNESIYGLDCLHCEEMRSDAENMGECDEE